MMLAAFAALALTSAKDDVWARFSADHALSHLKIDVEISTAAPSGGVAVYKLRQSKQKPGRKPQVVEIDTQSCPSLLTSLKALNDLPLPHANLPLDKDAPVFVIADGASYSLTIPADYPGASLGDVTVSSNVGTPLATWVDQVLTELDSCTSK